MKDTEKPVEDLLRILPMRTREILRILSRKECRSMVQELVYLIEARAAGRLRDMGDEVVTRLIPLDQIPEMHQAERLHFEAVSSELESPHL